MKECSWPGCPRKVDGWRWGCGEHWRALPENLRQMVTLEMQGSAQAVEAWIRATFGGEIRERWDPGKWERLCRWVRDRDSTRTARRAAEPKIFAADPES